MIRSQMCILKKKIKMEMAYNLTYKYEKMKPNF